MKKFFVSCMLIFSVTTHADVSIQLFKPFCEGSLARKRPISRLRSLAPGHVTPMIGLLVEARSGKRLFGIAPYLGVGHGNIVRAMERYFPELIDKTNPMSFASIWSGEIKWTGTDRLAFSQEFNEFSGFVAHMMALDSRNKNSVAELRKILEKDLPDFIRPDTTYTPYTEDALHLVPEMGSFQGGMRHGLGNMVDVLQSKLFLNKPMSESEVRETVDKFLLAIKLHRQHNWLTMSEKQGLRKIQHTLSAIKLAGNWGPIANDKKAFIAGLFFIANLATQAENTIIEIYEL